MRTLYWGIVAAGLVGVVLGLGLVPVPIVPDLPIETLQAWFVTEAEEAAAIGALIGVALAGLARLRLRYRPHRHSSDFPTRVAQRGVFALAAAAIAALVFGAVTAAIYDAAPLSWSGRITTLVISTKFLAGVAGAAVVASGLAYFAVTIARAWGGSYALSATAAGPGRKGA